MYSFEGDFRRRPQQSLGGWSSKEKREDLIQRAAQERQKREDFRRKVISSMKIQAFVRGHLARLKHKNYERIEFDKLKASADFNNATVNNMETALEKLLIKFLFFYDKSIDSSRMIWLCQIILRHSSNIIDWLVQFQDRWLFKFMKVLKLCIEYIKFAVAQKLTYALPFRIIEVFLDQSSYMKSAIAQTSCQRLISQFVLYLVKKGYYSSLRYLVDIMIPSSIELSVTASTPMADSLFHLLKKPLLFVSTLEDINFKNLVLREFCSSFLCPRFSSQVQEFIIPSLLLIGENFPFIEFITALLSFNTTNDGASRTEIKLEVMASPYLLYSLLSLASNCRALLVERGLWTYLQVLRLLMPTINNFQLESSDEKEMSSDSEDDDRAKDTPQEFYSSDDPRAIIGNATNLANEHFHVQLLLSAIENHVDESNLMALCHICHSLLMHNKLAIYKYRLLHTLAFKPGFLRYLWHSVANMSTSPAFGIPQPLLQLLSKGLPLSTYERNLLVPVIVLFCSLVGYLFQTLHDSEFYGTENGEMEQENQQSLMPFTLAELAALVLSLRDLCLGLIELTNPISRPSITDDYTEAVMSITQTSHIKRNIDAEEQDLQQWVFLFKVAVNLIRQLHLRDSRKSFCPKDHWIAKHISIPVMKTKDWHVPMRGLRFRRRFQALRNMIPANSEDNLPVSIVHIRTGIILRELPFLVPFHDRVLIFQHLVYKNKRETQNDSSEILAGPQIQIQVRRNYLYEDGFEKLSPQNEPNLKLKMRVQLVNFVGLDEAGIDGGGVLREFLNELLLTSFNPNRGFFILTLDHLLYPNPNVHLLFDDFLSHYYFIGRIVGKAIYENMLVELPFASFFLSKILGRHSANVDIDHLSSLDPVLYRNLLSLKHYDGDVADLGLDFTVVNEELGETKVEELEPGGSKIAVIEANKIRYIHLMADYKLNRQIHAQCNAFKQGLFNVVNPEWLHMFDWKELQVLISGAQIPIDIEDLRINTTYSGAFTEDHPLMHSFWKVVINFTEKQKRQLLKFVTSCSRPPLLGFKELYPTFCIHSAGSEDRLPTSSTCMNLLKLPIFKDEYTLKAKLLYAIEAESGFELS